MGSAEYDGIAPAHPDTGDMKDESIDMNLFIDPVKERKMMRKFDLCAISMLGLFYMMANLDRYVFAILTPLQQHLSFPSRCWP